MGDIVGMYVGSKVKFAVGSSLPHPKCVGSTVGTFVGAVVGWIVGKQVGRRVGVCVGGEVIGTQM